MIKVQNQTPEYLYNESRDFQLIGRIFESVFNHVKTSINTMGPQLYSDTASLIVDLAIHNTGFESKHQYNIEDLVALAHSFSSIIQIKGTKKSIEDCVRLLLRSQNITENFTVDIENSTQWDSSENPTYSNVVHIYVPKELTDIVLLEDLLDYVMPAGFIYEIVVSEVTDEYKAVVMSTSDNIQQSTIQPDSVLGAITQGQVSANDELTSYDKGRLDNTVVIKPEIEEE